ncbi:MAG: HAMP domain-containing sensor histidine kinase [Isosphaeraceae bacterium]
MEARTDPSRPSIKSVELQAVFSSLSLELCRPLGLLRDGFDSLLGDADRPVSPGQRDHLLTMLTLCDELRALTQEYLDFAKLSHETRPLRFDSQALGPLVNELGRPFAQRAADRRIALECIPDDPNATVETDPARCQILIGTLLDNALNATPPGGQVHLMARRDGDWWSLTVADTGTGIPPEYREQVFEPLFRIPRTTHPGQGMGLAVCRELVRQFKGEITIEPRPDQGTVAVVRLPAQAPANNPDAAC